MENCIFCKIIKGEIPCTKIYEDENFLAFLNIQPISLGHSLVIPKKHIVRMQESDDQTIALIFKLSKKLMSSIKNSMACDYVQLSVVGKDVPHFHIHLMPRYNNDNLPPFPIIKYQEGEMNTVAQKIISML